MKTGAGYRNAPHTFAVHRKADGGVLLEMQQNYTGKRQWFRFTSAGWAQLTANNAPDSFSPSGWSDITCRYCEEVIFETTGGLWKAPVDGGAAALCSESPDDQHAPEPDEETGKAENYQDGPCGDQ